MTKTEVKRYIDKLAKRAREFDALTHEINDLPDGGELEMCNQLTHTFKGKSVPYVHVYKGLREVAKIMGLTLKKGKPERYNDGSVYVTISTFYNGVMFMQMEDGEK